MTTRNLALRFGRNPLLVPEPLLARFVQCDCRRYSADTPVVHLWRRTSSFWVAPCRRKPHIFNDVAGFRKYIRDMKHNGIHETAGGLVVSNPEVLGGKPVFRGTRMPVSTLFEYLAEGLSLDYFLESFPSVTREQAVGVLLYGQRRIEEDLAA